MKQKTPMQKHIESIERHHYLIESRCPDDESTAWKLSMLEAILKDKNDMLEKEKEVMCEFAWEYERECRINLERNIEKCWYKTFNTKEK